MLSDSDGISMNKRFGRSAVSNGSRMLDGVDGRSPGARRFRDLVNSYCEGVGKGYDAMTEVERNTVRQAATAQLQSEALQSAIARGERVDTEQLVRLSNLSVRLLTKLGLVKSGNEDDGGDLATYLASRGEAA